MKQHATFKAVLSDVEGDDNKTQAILSVPVVDRDGEIVDAKAFDPLPESINIHVEHVMSLDAVVATAAPFYDSDGNLKADISWLSDSKSQRYKEKVKELHARGNAFMSIGFLSSQRERDAKGITHIVKGELLEASLVSVPSNREAAVTAVKNAGTLEIEPETTPKRTEKSVQGSFEHLANRLSDAVSASIGDRVWPKATFPNSFIYEQLDIETRTFKTFEVEFVEVDGEIVIDVPKSIDLVEVRASISGAKSAPVAEKGDTNALAEWQARINTWTKEVYQ
jgi:HK97 family phage prohead protease